MIVLDNAGTRALSLINTQNGANVEVCFSDYTTSTGAYARGAPTLTTISSGTTTSICATPASGTIRDIDYVNIYNTYAGSQTFTVQITSGSGGPFILVFATLAQNESLNYTHGSGWCAMDANGNRKEATSTVLASLTVTGNATIGGTLGVTGATTLAALTVSGAIVGAVTQSLLNTVSTTVNFAGGASVALNIGNAGGTNTILGVSNFSQGVNGTLGATTPAALSATTGDFGDVVTLTKASNSAVYSRVINSNASGAATAAFWSSNRTTAAEMGVLGTGYTTNGILQASRGYLFSNGGFAIGSTGDLYFSAGGTTQVGTWSSTGLAVTGTLSASGIGGIGAATSSTTNLNLAAGTTGVSTLRIPHGSAPSAPVDGDMWTTTAGLYIRINGGTVGPLS